MSLSHEDSRFPACGCKMSKRARGRNFTLSEKQTLLQVIEKYYDAVENKKTDNLTTAAKNESWLKLTEEFNSSSSFCARSTEQLRTCWDNIKRRDKIKEFTKKEIFLTGDGRHQNSSPSRMQKQVGTLHSPTLDVECNEYDSDANIQNVLKIELGESELDTESGSTTLENDTPGRSAAIEDDVPKIGEVEKLQSEFKEEEPFWNDWTCASKTPVPNTLQSQKRNTQKPWLHRRRPKKSLQESLLRSKIELAKLMIENVKKEAEKKDLILKEQLKQEMIKTEILRLQ